MDYDDSSRTLSSESVLSEETLTPDQDDLSDEQIDFLLQRASLRMKSKSSALIPSRAPSMNLPQLKGSSALPTPYTIVQAGVAKTEATRTVNEEQRRLSELPRKVEDPVAVKKAAKKERTFPLFTSLHFSSDDTLESPFVP
jgi:hypothetical protein